MLKIPETKKMLSGQVTRVARATVRNCSSSPSQATRSYAVASSAAFSAVPGNHNHKVVVIGGGAAGLSVSHQLLRSGQFSQGDIAIIDPSTWHHYQPGWTLVGGGLKDKNDLRKPLAKLINPKLKFHNDGVATFSPGNNSVTLRSGDKVTYEQLIVAPGIHIKYDSIKGLPEALADEAGLVSTIYGYDTCDKLARSVNQLKRGTAIFTQPSGIVKCAGAPQKAMWLAYDKWTRAGLLRRGDRDASPIKISFATGLPVMFGVPKYSAKLDDLRRQRGVEGLFQHDLVEIKGNEAVFAAAGGEKVTRHFDFLHAVPKMGPHQFVAQSPLANEAGLVDVDDATMQHKKYPNVWSLGDASSLPTSKTAAAITSQAPILVSNVMQMINAKGKALASYDGYTSCPITTSYGKVLLAEFVYGGKPKETFGKWLGIDQAIPRKAFYYLKKDFFPWVYYKFMMKGRWAGPNGFNTRI
ncbi:hypothetical protein S7711_03463 [Stachybotrys chartarum IBT 7711]|uniref:FAD/NAD(P)-binding domain-containing protein n=1 Tax=Stachybotrys chartarum (strain CBS 109288 / IBT 7711) TaxID=1280523 RepID=A0A084AFU0_STACB|nr:hypothetical protein S7711_03463 [Stachybotrys chartarum IBT 7711]